MNTLEYAFKIDQFVYLLVNNQIKRALVRAVQCSKSSEKETVQYTISYKEFSEDKPSSHVHEQVELFNTKEDLYKYLDNNVSL